MSKEENRIFQAFSELETLCGGVFTQNGHGKNLNADPKALREYCEKEGKNYEELIIDEVKRFGFDVD